MCTPGCVLLVDELWWLHLSNLHNSSAFSVHNQLLCNLLYHFDHTWKKSVVGITGRYNPKCELCGKHVKPETSLLAKGACAVGQVDLNAVMLGSCLVTAPKGAWSSGFQTSTLSKTVYFSTEGWGGGGLHPIYIGLPFSDLIKF